MSSSFKRGVITLVKNAIKGENSPLPEEFEYSWLYEFALRQHILPLVYYGGKDIACFTAWDENRRMYSAAIYAALVNQDRFSMLEEICHAFENAGIDYMPLKGAVVKKYYPGEDMRLLGDADILIREEQAAELEKAMTGLGYKYDGTSDYDWKWKKNGFEVELHRKLVPSHTKDLCTYLGDGWGRARLWKEGGHEYALSCEDELIYLFSHFTKHYRHSGIGIKHFVDIYVFLGAHPELDADYVGAELDKLGIGAFYQNVKRTLAVWFDGAEADEITEFITDKIFSGDAYGTQDQLAKYQAAVLTKDTNTSKARNQKILSVVFLNYKDMCVGRPWLKKCPLLLPFAWVARLIMVVLFRRENVKKIGRGIAVINDKDIEAYKAELRLVGLDFNFEV